MACVLFQMWGGHRRGLIASHNFYVEQARKRLLSQFKNMEEDADKYANEWLEKAGMRFDPDRDNQSDYYEQANEEGIEFYLMLEEMRNRTRMSVIAAIFHEWEKQLRSWLCDEIQHWHHGGEVTKQVWKANFSQVVELLAGIGFDIRAREYYLSIDRCRLVVNAYKHGDGSAFENLKNQYPEFIESYGVNDGRYIEFADYSHLVVQERHIAEFSIAIVSFWEEVPENIYSDQSLSIPRWLEKAFEKDKAEHTSKDSQ